jgi:PAS domain S-box-containing protein
VFKVSVGAVNLEQVRSLKPPTSKTVDEPPAAPVDAATEYALLHMDADGTLNAWNPSVRRVFGWERDGFIGQRVHLTFTPEDVAAGVPEREMATAAREDVARDARWHVRRDGSRFLATDIVHPLRDGRGRVHGYTKIVSDATARDEAERRLARKAALIDLSPDALFVQEAETSRILLWSRGAETTYGWRRAGALPMSCSGRSAPCPAGRSCRSWSASATGRVTSAIPARTADVSSCPPDGRCRGKERGARCWRSTAM